MLQLVKVASKLLYEVRAVSFHSSSDFFSSLFYSSSDACNTSHALSCAHMLACFAFLPMNFQGKERLLTVYLTEQAWSITLVFIIWLSKIHFSCRTRQVHVLPSRQDSSILPAQVVNHSAGFDSSALSGLEIKKKVWSQSCD